MVRTTVIAALVSMLVALLVGIAAPASAHEERESHFPPGDGSVPVHRDIGEAADVLVVCKPDSAERIQRISDPKLRSFNQQLLGRCGFRHLQAAVDAVSEQGTNIYLLPGHYREQPSWDPECGKDYDGGVASYRLMTTCGEVLNLVTIAGDDPDDPDITCDNALCDLQIEGTGARPEDVLFTGGFRENGDWVKHNGLKADRADGFFLANVTFELFRENAVYVHETDGYTVDDVVARKNDLYGLLTFASDHGFIRDCETYFNGDSGVYPGSASDVNSQNTTTGPLQRWAVEISGCDTHHNGAGYVTDSVVGDHPGMPQDHAWLEDNRIYSNNVNYYPNVRDGGPCTKTDPADRGHQDGVVCPAFPVPVGTGVMIAGGNRNFVTSNEIYDNWRYGVMLFWAPAGIRGEYDPAKQQDNPHHNAFTHNQFGYRPGGAVLPNGLDVWWDDAGTGNCWDDNLATPGKEITHNATDPRGLPDCPTGSMWPVGNVVKSAQLLPCSQYNRESNPDPAGCDWMDTPPRPGSSESASDTMNTMSMPVGASGIGMLLAAAAGLVVWRRRTST